MDETRLGPDFIETIVENLPFFLQQIEQLAHPPEPEIELSRLELITVFLLKQTKTCNMGTLTKVLSVPMSTATGIAERLEKKGLIRRDKSEQDRRAIDLKLLPEGEDLAARYLQHAESLIMGLKSNLTKEEYEILSILLRKVMAGKPNSQILFRMVK